MVNMKTINEKIYYLYKKWQKNPIVATLSSFIYVRILNRIVIKRAWKETVHDVSLNGLPNVAFICDEMTWQDFKSECNAIFVTPYNWQEAFNNFCPDVLFCESAWSGNAEYKDCWRGQIYKNKNIRYENRRTLFQVLEYCREKGIPTVFWNKEDPAFWGNETYNFVDTALHFDHIFTTAKECLPNYRKLGHTSVHVLMFGFSPDIYFYDSTVEKKKKAVFAGSWYADQPKRCAEMEAVFDMVLEQNIPLEIYDRQSDSSNPVHRFPDKYKQFLYPKVAFTELGKIYRGAEYIININTVTDSGTMFARRVFEAMACGCIVISNPSLGLKKIFPKRIWFSDETFDHGRITDIRSNNLQEVFQDHTCQQKLTEVLQICGLK